MTNDERKAVQSLQAQGHGYKKISAITGISADTIRTFCRRNPVTPLEAPYPTSRCKNCGAVFDLIPKRKPKQFCSDACRINWWNAHPDLVNRKTWHTFICACCERTFRCYAIRKRKYCSQECAAKARQAIK